jgi:hypothetical protein
MTIFLSELMQDVRHMKTSPLTDEEKECIQEVITCDYRLSSIFHVCFLLLTFFHIVISGAENIQKRLDISLEVCSAT